MLNWAIAGPGRMAAAMAADFPRVTNGEMLAVGSRSIDRAAAFAAEHGIDRAYGSYAELIADPDVDALYIATPHAQHAELALAAIEARKAVLVEKAFTTSVAETSRVIEAARAAGVFAMEAMWTRFNPGIVEARRLVESGEIGELRAMQGDLIAYRAFDASDRLFAADLGGGAVLDLGVYVLSLAQYFMGTPTVVHAHGGTYSTGVEGEFGALVGYPDGRTATLAAAFTARGPGRMMLVGTDGWIDLHPRFHRVPALTLWRGSESETLRFDSGYHYQVIHAGECIDAGLTESPVMPLSDTQEVQQLMAEVLNQIHS
ncbi:MAG TPA: Gfo/Idh/MocA family oxidoreductase [Marmoricola sp.]|nr:Gfo/Idh/MocA family oxidoreductase [Marmoricola sp.]